MWLCAIFSPLAASSGSTSRHDSLYPETCVWLGEGCHVTLSVLILALTFSSVGAKITERQETQVVTFNHTTFTSRCLCRRRPDDTRCSFHFFSTNNRRRPRARPTRRIFANCHESRTWTRPYRRRGRCGCSALRFGAGPTQTGPRSRPQCRLLSSAGRSGWAAAPSA